MRVTDIQRSAPQPGRVVKALATFDIQISADVRMFGLRLMEAPDGRLLIYAPSGNGGRRLATFSPKLAEEIADIAAAELEGARNRHDHSTRD